MTVFLIFLAWILLGIGSVLFYEWVWYKKGEHYSITMGCVIRGIFFGPITFVLMLGGLWEILEIERRIEAFFARLSDRWHRFQNIKIFVFKNKDKK